MFDMPTYVDVALFISDFEDGCLAKELWTHQAHLIVGFWYLNKLNQDEALATIRERILRYNDSVGTANTDSSGYHETLTRLYMSAISTHISEHSNKSFEESMALLFESPLGDKAWPLTYYSKELLFSVRARREWLEPDLQTMDENL